jgi:hypothetical protein
MIRFRKWKAALRVLCWAIAAVVALWLANVLVFVLYSLYEEWPRNFVWCAVWICVFAVACGVWRYFRRHHWVPVDPAVEYPPGAEPPPRKRRRRA